MLCLEDIALIFTSQAHAVKQTAQGLTCTGSPGSLLAPDKEACRKLELKTHANAFPFNLGKALP